MSHNTFRYVESDELVHFSRKIQGSWEIEKKLKNIGAIGDRTRDFSLRRRIHHQNSVMNVISEHTKPKESAGAVSFFVT